MLVEESLDQVESHGKIHPEGRQYQSLGLEPQRIKGEIQQNAGMSLPIFSLPPYYMWSSLSTI